MKQTDTSELTAADEATMIECPPETPALIFRAAVAAIEREFYGGNSHPVAGKWLGNKMIPTGYTLAINYQGGATGILTGRGPHFTARLFGLGEGREAVECITATAERNQHQGEAAN